MSGLSWVAMGAGLLLIVGARVLAVAQRGPNRVSAYETQFWNFGNTPAGEMRAVALVPRDRAPSERFPLLIALHGLGETERGVERGAWGWSRDYELGSADMALRRGVLPANAFFGLIDDSRLRALRHELRRARYRGLVVVTPFTPDVRGDLGGASHQAYESWVVGPLLARARASLPVIPTREATGIDGVSLGGLHALWTGLAHPEVFGSVGALQPAVRDRQEEVAARYVQAPARPSQRIRIVTSDHDSLRPDVTQLDEVFTAHSVQHEFRTLVGPHDYVFNRGPGGIEMLLFHDRALRGQDMP